MLKSNGLLSCEERQEEMKQMEVYRSHTKFMKNKVCECSLPTDTDDHLCFVSGLATQIRLTPPDGAGEAGSFPERHRAARSADKAGDSYQSVFRQQAAHRSPQGVAHCQGTASCHPADGGKGSSRPNTIVTRAVKTTSHSVTFEHRLKKRNVGFLVC